MVRNVCLVSFPKIDGIEEEMDAWEMLVLFGELAQCPENFTLFSFFD